jgi:hypothetical protein
MVRMTHCLDNRLTDGYEVVSLMHRPRFTPRNLLVLISVRGRTMVSFAGMLCSTLSFQMQVEVL